MSLIISKNNNQSLDEANGNVMGTSSTITTKYNDEDSTSGSDYTDPENSAPTELLAEFLTSIMKRDYVNALKHCKMILEFEPHNKTAKDFYPQLLLKVNAQTSSSSDQSDENCNYTSSLEFVDNEILDNDMIDNYSETSSISSSNTSSNDSLDVNSYSDEEVQQREQDQEDLINPLSFGSNNSSSKSDPFPESMSSSESYDHRGDYSPTFSFQSLLLEENDDVNNNEQQVPVAEPEVPMSSPFTSKLVNMIRRKLN